MDGRAPGREPFKDVARLRVAGRVAGAGRETVDDVARLRVAERAAPFVMEAAEGGREMEGRAWVVPLKDCLDEEREGAAGWDDG